MCGFVIDTCCDSIEAQAWSEAGAEDSNTDPSLASSVARRCVHDSYRQMGAPLGDWASLWLIEATLQSRRDVFAAHHLQKIVQRRESHRATPTNLHNGWSWPNCCSVRRCFWGEAWSTSSVHTRRCIVHTGSRHRSANARRRRRRRRSPRQPTCCSVAKNAT
jgi:hypothetical protein